MISGPLATSNATKPGAGGMSKGISSRSIGATIYFPGASVIFASDKPADAMLLRKERLRAVTALRGHALPYGAVFTLRPHFSPLRLSGETGAAATEARDLKAGVRFDETNGRDLRVLITLRGRRDLFGFERLRFFAALKRIGHKADRQDDFDHGARLRYSGMLS